MKKFRTYKKYSLVYELEREDAAFRISIEKVDGNGVENSSYVVNGREKELKALLCRLWSCGVTPMSLVYILEDEGYIPQTTDEDASVFGKGHQIVKRKHSCLNKSLASVFEACSDDGALAVINGELEEV